MLLPSKGVQTSQALITVGADALSLLSTPQSPAGLWERYMRDVLPARVGVITFDWFSLALASLFSMGLIDATPEGLLRRVRVRP